MNGKGTLTHPSGEKYSGEFKDDKKHGKGYYIYPNGTTYEGGYKNDVFHGKGKFIDPMGKILEGNFKNGKLKMMNLGIKSFIKLFLIERKSQRRTI
jgi:hypothetical protein